tara:strand:+ start:1692 stop:1814 length:123 start_codon:yes stop_codon:yes gene_type:complete
MIKSLLIAVFVSIGMYFGWKVLATIFLVVLAIAFKMENQE